MAINAGKPIFATISPFISPNNAPLKRITRSTMPIGTPFSIRVPPISAEQIAIVPIERSMPPVPITKVTPIAINAT